MPVGCLELAQGIAERARCSKLVLGMVDSVLHRMGYDKEYSEVAEKWSRRDRRELADQ